MIINFGPWAPDQPRYMNPCITATNVYPVATGYGPFPGTSTIMSSALPAGCVGSISLKRVDGTIETFAGTATKLYRRNGNSWTDVSQGGGTYTTGTFWRFAVYGLRLLATNGQGIIQAFDMGTDTEFADLTGAPTCDSIIVVRDTVVALACASGDDIQWSANNDSEKWSAACGGGGQAMYEGGPVVGGTGGEFGVVLQEQGLTRMTFVGGDTRFTFDRIEGSVGCIAAESIVEWKGSTFYLSGEGFQVFNGGTSQNISDELVSAYFFDNCDSLSTVEGALDPQNSCVVWNYSTSGGNKLLIFNYKLNRWSESDAAVDVLHTQVTSTGEVLGCFVSDTLSTFSGSDRTAVVSTGDLDIFPGRSAFIRSVRPLVDAACTVTVGKKTDLADAESTQADATNSNGKASIRSRGKYQRIQVSPTATFTEIVGANVEAVQSGGRV